MNKKLTSLEKYVNLQRNLMNEKRLRILFSLDEEKMTWSQLMHEFDLRNPKILHDHMTSLLNFELIEKNSKGFYQITKLGRVIMKGNVKLMEKIDD